MPTGEYRFETEQYLTVIVPTGCTAYYAWDLDETVIDIRNPEAIRLAYENGIRVPSGEHKLSLVIIDNSTGAASTVYRQLYTCTMPGIPVPEEFLPQPSEEPIPENPDNSVVEPEENEFPEGNETP